MSLVDIVNLHSDASCLSSRKWLKCLEYGHDSSLYQLLDNYVKNERKVNLGITGATVKDMIHFNSEAIDKINSHPEIFEIMLRSFSHDLSPLRSCQGFKFNLG